MEVAPGIFRLTLPMPQSFMVAVNLYLIRDHDGYALVDCGQEVPDAWPALVEQLEQLDVPLRALHTIVVTHGHLDHYGLAARLHEQTGAQVWLHEKDAAFMRYRYLYGETYRELLATWLLKHGFSSAEAGEVTISLEEARRHTPLVAPTRLLQGNEVLAAGPYRFEVSWTPGHTPGHICLYDPRQKILLSGDHILERVAPNVGLQPYVSDNPLPGYLASLQQLAGLEIDLALPGHGDPMPDLARRAQQILNHQLARREHLLGLLTAQPQTAYELAGEVWADSTPVNWARFRPGIRRNAVGTLAAHLELLAQEGRLARYQDEVVRYGRLG